jgi:hypothetical protein
MTEIWDLFAHVADITAWLDTANPPTPHEDSMRVLKLVEEAGEAAAAYIGMVGQNPRKGVTHSLDDLLGELADVALTALCAMQHFTQGQAATRAVLASKVQRIIARADIPRRAAPSRTAAPADGLPDLTGTGLAWNPAAVAYHGRDELERTPIYGRLALAGHWPAKRPVECEFTDRRGVWLADGMVLACPGCGLDCT